MFLFLKKVSEVQNGLSVSAFARELGMKQKTVDLYMKGERKPSVDFVVNICSKFGVSANWLLGLPERATSSTAIANGGVAISGSGNKIHGSIVANDRLPTKCESCKYKRLADAFKAI